MADMYTGSNPWGATTAPVPVSPFKHAANVQCEHVADILDSRHLSAATAATPTIRVLEC